MSFVRDLNHNVSPSPRHHSLILLKRNETKQHVFWTEHDRAVRILEYKTI